MNYTTRIPSADKLLYYISRGFSFLFSPLLIPTYGIFLAFSLSYLMILPRHTMAVVTMTTFLITGILPFAAILLLWRKKRVGEPSLRNRHDRFWPYLITVGCYLGCMAYLMALRAPAWLWAFLLGAAVSLLIVMAINLRWKISAHATALGGLLAMMFRIVSNGYNPLPMEWWLTGCILVAGIVGTARILLGRHTLLQVLAGWGVGFVPVYFLSML